MTSCSKKKQNQRDKIMNKVINNKLIEQSIGQESSLDFEITN